MRLKIGCFLASLLLPLAVLASDPGTSDVVVSNVSVPHLLRFSGTLPGHHTVVGVTFALYKDQTGGSPLWQEVQNVNPDESGHYSVLLGSTTSQGLPADLFSGTDARWLGIRIESGEELARVQLVSVPYALKAGDAETLGGMPLSAFVLAPASSNPAATGTTSNIIVPAARTSLAVTAANLTAAAPLMATQFADTTSTEVVLVSQAGSGYGLHATSVNLPAVYGQSSSTTSAAFYGQSTAISGAAVGVRGDTASTAGIGLYGIASATSGRSYGVRGDNASTGGIGLIGFETAGTGATVGLQGQVSSTGGTALVGQASATSGSTKGVYGQVSSANGIAGVFNNLNGGKALSVQSAFVEKLSIDVNGNTTAAGMFTSSAGGFKFPDGSVQTSALPSGCNANQIAIWSGTAWNCQNGATGTVTSVVAGTGLSGGTITGTGTLSVDGTTVPLLAAANTYTNNQTIVGNVSVSGLLGAGTVNATNSYQIGGSRVFGGDPISANTFFGFGTGPANTTGSLNLFTGYTAGFSNTTGAHNTFEGAGAGYSNTDGSSNAFTGESAGYNNTDGVSNSFFGQHAGFSNTVGSYNTFSGNDAGATNITGNRNTAIGFQAGYSNQSSDRNTFAGFQAGYFTTGPFNTFTGSQAGYSNTTGSSNTFAGDNTGYANTTGSFNTFTGSSSGSSNLDGGYNTFNGENSGAANTDGSYNTFVGAEAGNATTTGVNNTLLGENTGIANTAGNYNTYVGGHAGYTNNGSNNVYLGYNTGNDPSITAESNTMRLGGPAVANTFVEGVFGVSVTSGVPVVVDSTGHLGTSAPSSVRFKENIRELGDVSAGLFKLRPVSFYYKRSFDPSPTRYLQYGLIAEEVAEVYPELVTYDAEGRPNAIKYQYFTPLMLNEMQKQFKLVRQQQSVIQSQQEQIESQSDEIRALQQTNRDIQERLQKLEALMASHSN